MLGKDTLKRHAELVDQMATHVGVDLEDAALGGDVSIDQISNAVLRCSDCSNPDHCEQFLAHSSPDRKTPEYCRNAALFDRLTLLSDSKCDG
ncbi:DUF6455 family protein [Ruegeria atlantica]|uniref:DUF6455 family protein n=1 Tax=Ruegeria atlantica TaxID=81569 RepID=UPI00147EF462|nr:DUF6455 family protein [Ruegeria atlantica]